MGGICRSRQKTLTSTADLVLVVGQSANNLNLEIMKCVQPKWGKFLGPVPPCHSFKHPSTPISTPPGRYVMYVHLTSDGAPSPAGCTTYRKHGVTCNHWLWAAMAEEGQTGGTVYAGRGQARGLTGAMGISMVPN